MRKIPTSRHGALSLCLALSLLGCSSQRARPPVPDVVAEAHEVKVAALQYVPVDEALTRRIAVAGYASAQIVNRMLEGRIAALEAAVAEANIRFAAIRCLEGTVPGSPEAAACTDAARLALSALQGAPPP